MINGMYIPPSLGDLGCCGCAGATTPDTSGFDLSSIPMWAWLVAAGVGAFMLLKKH